jgi:ATP synthase F1 gamma subunit
MPIIKQKWGATTKVAKMCESMKNVAAGALPGCERHLANARPFGSVTVPLFQLEKEDDDSIKNILHIPIGTERGMCGAVSSNTVRAAGANAAKMPQCEHAVIVYGKRSAAVCNTMFGDKLKRIAGEVKTKQPTFEFCCHLAEFILYELEFKWDKIVLYFNEYENAVRSHLRTAVIYKAELSQLIAEVQFPTYEVEADTRTMIDNLVEYKLACSLYMYMAENYASEQGSRLRSMDSAFENCKEKELEYEQIYQGLRKTKITNELIILAVAGKIASLKRK